MQFENKVLTKITGPQRHEVTVRCRRLHNEELHERSVLLTKYYPVDDMKNEISAASGVYGAGERCILGFGGET